MGVDSLLSQVVDRIPPPAESDPSAPLKLLLFDAYHDEFRGVVCLVEVLGGALFKGQRLTAASTGESYDALVGLYFGLSMLS